MITFEIDIPDRIYKRGIRHAKELGITFSEFCSLSVLKLMKYSDDELRELATEMNERKSDERGEDN
jgi:hypothetical protein